MRKSEFVQFYLSEQAKTMDHLALLVAITVGLVTVVFAIGAFLVWRENRNVFERINAEIERVKERRANIEKWFAERRTTFYEEMGDKLREFEIQLEQMRSFQIIQGAIDKAELHPAIIFPALAFLSEHPSPLHVSLFKELKRLEITPDITERACMGLQKLQQIRQDRE